MDNHGERRTTLWNLLIRIFWKPGRCDTVANFHEHLQHCEDIKGMFLKHTLRLQSLMFSDVLLTKDGRMLICDNSKDLMKAIISFIKISWSTTTILVIVFFSFICFFCTHLSLSHTVVASKWDNFPEIVPLEISHQYNVHLRWICSRKSFQASTIFAKSSILIFD